MRETALGDFLRVRRGQLSVDDVALVDAGGRRVPGLRREEVAMLAGVSVAYLTRLEQGRSNRPSTEVLNALADALQLDRESRSYLFAVGSGPSTTCAADDSSCAPTSRVCSTGS